MVVSGDACVAMGNTEMLEQLRNTCRELLEQDKVQVVIGYGEGEAGEAFPVFITDPKDVDQLVFDARCHANLVSYLKRKEVRKLGKPAVIVKGCDERALLVLESESQVERGEIVVVGVLCDGVGAPRERKCESCDVHVPRTADVLIGEGGVENASVTPEERYAALEELMAMSPDERLAYWQKEFSRCFKCYACRQSCPMCYCEQCIADKNMPVVIETSATARGNFAWHVARAFHLAGRCVGCGECSRACPAGIDLDLLNLSLAKAAEEQFGFRAGMEQGTESLIGAYSEEDKEEFIG